MSVCLSSEMNGGVFEAKSVTYQMSPGPAAQNHLLAGPGEMHAERMSLFSGFPGYSR